MEGAVLMASSGTTSFALQIDDVIEEAYDRCGIESRSGYDLKTARRSLNLLLQNLQNEHPALWKTIPTSQALVKGTTSYTLDAKILDMGNVVIRRNGVDTQISRLSRDEYQSRPNKSSEGRPTQYYFEKLTTPKLYVYPAPENSTDTIEFYAVERIEDVGNYDNTMDVPSNAVEMVTSGLAYKISVKRSPERVQFLKSIYDEEKLRFEQEDSEGVSTRLLPGVAHV